MGLDGSEEFKGLFVAESLGIGPSLGGGDDEVVFFIKAVIDGVVNLLLIDVVVLSSFLNVVTAEEFVNLLFKNEDRSKWETRIQKATNLSMIAEL